MRTTPTTSPPGAAATSGGSNHVNVQMQWDVADWPCYAKYYAAWSLGELPAGAEVISATVELRQFGNPGFSPGYADDGTKDTVMQVFEVDKPWQEDTITWDNAPVPQENTSRTLVQPLPGDCAPTPYWYCSPGIPYQFDVTEIVRRAQAEGRNWASLALYTAAGQYHSGKYFYSREGAEPPVVRIAYLPAAAQGSRPAPPAPAPAWEPVLDSARAFLQVLLESFRAAQPEGTYYISPQGDDGSDGTSAGAPWRTFAHAWDVLQPGDRLLLLDGIYTESTTGVVQPNIRNGEPGKPITIKALNDGKAVIDGEGRDIPVRLGENWGPDGPIGDWFVVEGLVARNGTLSSIRLEHANHNVLRRVSAYDADPDDNSLAIGIAWSDHNLVEDCVAAGTGRYMINVFTSSDNTIRRCFTMWQQWDGRHFCGVSWPNGNNVGVYNSSNTTVENVIAYGRGAHRHLHPGQRRRGGRRQQPGPGQHGAAAGRRLRRQPAGPTARASGSPRRAPARSPTPMASRAPTTSRSGSGAATARASTCTARVNCTTTSFATSSPPAMSGWAGGHSTPAAPVPSARSSTTPRSMATAATSPAGKRRRAATSTSTAATRS